MSRPAGTGEATAAPTASPPRIDGAAWRASARRRRGRADAGPGRHSRVPGSIHHSHRAGIHHRGTRDALGTRSLDIHAPDSAQGRHGPGIPRSVWQLRVMASLASGIPETECSKRRRGDRSPRKSIAPSSDPISEVTNCDGDSVPAERRGVRVEESGEPVAKGRRFSSTTPTRARK